MTTMAQVGRGTISERNELFPPASNPRGLFDCTYASFMRACADAGIVFPLANDLDREREALERSDNRPDETGAKISDAVLACERRYGYSGEAVHSMASALCTPGYTLVLQGDFDHLPDRLRHWSPAGTFPHAIPYRVLTPSSGVVLDPLGPMGYAGETASPNEMGAFCYGAAYMRAFAWEAAMVPKAVTSEAPATMTVAKGVGWYDLDGKTQLETGAGELVGRFSPYEVGAQRAMFATIDGVRRVVLVTPVRGSVKAVPPVVVDKPHVVRLVIDGAIWKEATI